MSFVAPRVPYFRNHSAGLSRDAVPDNFLSPRNSSIVERAKSRLCFDVSEARLHFPH